MNYALCKLHEAATVQRNLLTACNAEIATDNLIGSGELGLIYLPVRATASHKLAELEQAIEILKDELSS